MAMRTTCHFCGGALRAVGGPGRWRDYRGVRCEIPSDLLIATCTSCSRSWMPDADVSRLSAAFETQRIAARGATPTCASVTVRFASMTVRFSTTPSAVPARPDQPLTAEAVHAATGKSWTFGRTLMDALPPTKEPRVCNTERPPQLIAAVA